MYYLFLLRLNLWWSGHTRTLTRNELSLSTIQDGRAIQKSLLSVHQDYCTSHSSLSTHRLLNCRDTEKQLITAAHDGGECDARFISLGYLQEGVLVPSSVRMVLHAEPTIMVLDLSNGCSCRETWYTLSLLVLWHTHSINVEYLIWIPLHIASLHCSCLVH